MHPAMKELRQRIERARPWREGSPSVRRQEVITARRCKKRRYRNDRKGIYSHLSTPNAPAHRERPTRGLSAFSHSPPGSDAVARMVRFGPFYLYLQQHG